MQFYIETYGCQMNFADSEILASILNDLDYHQVDNYKEADLMLINTCSIRDHAEQRVLNRLNELKALKKHRKVYIGIVGCMASRMKEELLKKEYSVDLVIGPDAYRSIPELLKKVDAGEKGIDTELSEEETYHDITPLRLDNKNISAFVSIMRGCQNFCAYCVVPYTRGKERSREPQSIVDEVKDLFQRGYREVTLLGQNVNSYHYEEVGFPELMERVALVSPLLRVRFATSHPKDLSDDLLKVMAKYPNICKYIHLPVQSGSSRMLQVMKRKYTREWYLERIAAIRKYLPDCSISTDIIAGFCTETEEDHRETLSIMREVGYSSAYMFKYSERPGTYASKHYTDDIPEEEKLRRLNEIIALQQQLSLESNQADVDKEFEILIEGSSKKNADQFYGRNSQNKVVVFDNPYVTDAQGEKTYRYKEGDYIRVLVESCTAATLKGRVVGDGRIA